MELTKEKIYELIDEANSLLDRAYVPYSNFPVAAVIIDENNNKHYGVNVENASYGLGLCAERNGITTAITNGMKKIKVIVITAKKPIEPVSPCGACRQVIKEFSDENTIIILANYNNKEFIKWTVEEMIPYGFNSNNL